MQGQTRPLWHKWCAWGDSNERVKDLPETMYISVCQQLEKKTFVFKYEWRLYHSWKAYKNYIKSENGRLILMCIFYVWCKKMKQHSMPDVHIVYKSQQKTIHRQIILNMRAAGKITQTATKNQYRKLKTNIPRKGIEWPQSHHFHIHVSVSNLFIPTIDLPILLREICGPILGIYINRSQTYEWGNRDWGPQFPEKEYINGIFIAVHSYAPSIRSQRGTLAVLPDFQTMRVSEEPVCIYLFGQNPVSTSLLLKSL